MRKAFTTLAVLTATVLSTVSIASAPASAAPGNLAVASTATTGKVATISDSEYFQIVMNGADAGTYTSAQLGKLATRPDISRQAPEVKTTSVQLATKAKWKSKKVDRYVKVKFSDGGSFRHHLWVSWSYNGKKILGKPSTGQHLTHTGIWQIRISGKAKVSNRWTRANHYSMETIIVGKWKQCVAGICIASNGVQGQFGLYGNGHHTFKGKIVDA